MFIRGVQWNSPKNSSKPSWTPQPMSATTGAGYKPMNQQLAGQAPFSANFNLNATPTVTPPMLYPQLMPVVSKINEYVYSVHVVANSRRVNRFNRNRTTVNICCLIRFLDKVYICPKKNTPLIRQLLRLMGFCDISCFSTLPAKDNWGG